MNTGFGCLACRMSRRGMLAGIGGLAAASAAPRAFAAGKPTAIDFHAHMLNRDLLARKGGLPAGPSNAGQERLFLPEAHLKDMDLYGVGRQVITMSNAIQGISWGDVATDAAIHRQLNDEIHNNWVARFPDRFIGSCTLPLQDIDLSIRELERASRDLKAKVVQISSCTPDGVYFGDPKLRPFWDAVTRLDMVAFVHPHLNAASPPLDDFALANSVGQGIEEAKFMSSMIYQGMFDRYPDLKIVVAHGGGFLPHYYGRMDRNVKNAPDSARNIKKMPSAYLKSFYYDSCLYSPDILTALIKVVGIDRMVLGGDYPVGVFDPLAELRECKSLSRADFDKIATVNAARILGLPA